MRIKPVEVVLIVAISAALILGSWLKLLPYSMMETLGFVTGAACVYLVVREHSWNFPIGIVSSILYLVVFWEERLFGDAGLQIVFVTLGFHGWYWWLRGGENRSELHVTRASARFWIGITIFLGLSTYALKIILTRYKGSVPFLDAFTTALSLAAQYLLNNKKIENWILWIVADVIYVYVYLIKGLQLTAVLYAIFLVMCVAGLIEWRKSLHRARLPLIEPLPHPGPAHE